MSVELLIKIAILAMLIAAPIVVWRLGRTDQFQSFVNFSAAVFHIFAAVAIGAAGIWVVLQRDWAPKASVDVKANVAVLERAEPRAALVQVIVGMKNEGRMPHKFSNIAIVARSYDPTIVKADKYGDLAQTTIDQFISSSNFRIMPGETDFAYAELRVPCSEPMIQIFVDIAEPKHFWKSKRPLSYERKLVLPLTEACTDKPAAAPRERR